VLLLLAFGRMVALQQRDSRDGLVGYIWLGAIAVCGVYKGFECRQPELVVWFIAPLVSYAVVSVAFERHDRKQRQASDAPVRDDYMRK
jgi:hypothetical protein